LSDDEKAGNKKLYSILNVLSDPPSLEMLNEASKGFISGDEVIHKLALTSRQYYRYLKKMRDAGLITASGTKYYLTPLGKNFHRLLINNALSLLSLDSEISGSFPNSEEKSDLRIIDHYDELVNVLNVLIEKSKSEISIATKYVDFSITLSLLSSIQKGVRIKSISNIGLNLTALFGLLKTMIGTIRPKSLLKSLGNADYRMGEVPMSFIIIDNEIGVFEIPSEDFKMAFCTSDRQIIKALSELFDGLWIKCDKLGLELSSRNNKETTE
jgi:predicted transcriptional regulator